MMPWETLYKQLSILKTYLCGDNETISFTLLGMVTLSIEEEVEEGESCWVRDLQREIQLKDLGEVPLEDLEGEMVEDSIPKVLWKEMKDIGRKRNGQVLQVMGVRGRDIPISSHAACGSHQRTPPTPAPSEDLIFMDWSSVRLGSSLVRTPLQSISIRERGHKTNQIGP